MAGMSGLDLLPRIKALGPNLPVIMITAYGDPDTERRAFEAGAPRLLNTFRATGVTAYLKNGGTFEKAAQMANHASARTTQLYDRRAEEVTLEEVERILV